MRKIEYLCDRCRKPISYELLAENDFPYILYRRLPTPANPIMVAQGPSIDLCENCRNSFKKWLGEEDT